MDGNAGHPLVGALSFCCAVPHPRCASQGTPAAPKGASLVSAWVPLGVCPLTSRPRTQLAHHAQSVSLLPPPLEASRPLPVLCGHKDMFLL